jgi:hypothetical protein
MKKPTTDTYIEDLNFIRMASAAVFLASTDTEPKRANIRFPFLLRNRIWATNGTVLCSFRAPKVPGILKMPDGFILTQGTWEATPSNSKVYRACKELVIRKSIPGKPDITYPDLPQFLEIPTEFLPTPPFDETLLDLLVESAKAAFNLTDSKPSIQLLPAGPGKLIHVLVTNFPKQTDRYIGAIMPLKSQKTDTLEDLTKLIPKAKLSK